MSVTSPVYQIKTVLSAERRYVQAFDLDHAFDAFQSVDDALQVLQIVDVHSKVDPDRKSTRLNSSHTVISYAVFCLKKKKKYTTTAKGTTGKKPRRRSTS